MISSSDFASIAALDLQPISTKLMHPEAGEGWSSEKTSAVEFEYQRFLYLMKTFPNEQTSPSVDVDTFWHYHILDTVKYAADCHQAFGYFLHHNPYVGLRGAGDEEVRQQSGKRMSELYEQTFGSAYGDRHWAAYCSITGHKSGGATGQPAYCSIAASAYYPVGEAQASYCSVTAAQQSYCSITVAKPSYCSITTATPSYCSVAEPAHCSEGIAHLGVMNSERLAFALG